MLFLCLATLPLSSTYQVQKLPSERKKKNLEIETHRTQWKKKKKTTNPKKTHTQTGKQPTDSRLKFKPSFNTELRPIQATHPFSPVSWFFLFLFYFMGLRWERRKGRKKRKKERLNERTEKEERKVEKKKKEKKNESKSKVMAGRSLGVCLITKISLKTELWKLKTPKMCFQFHNSLLKNQRIEWWKQSYELWKHEIQTSLLVMGPIIFKL